VGLGRKGEKGREKKEKREKRRRAIGVRNLRCRPLNTCKQQVKMVLWRQRMAPCAVCRVAAGGWRLAAGRLHFEWRVGVLLGSWLDM
jgi:hypothetical protein